MGCLISSSRGSSAAVSTSNPSSQTSPTKGPGHSLAATIDSPRSFSAGGDILDSKSNLADTRSMDHPQQKHETIVSESASEAERNKAGQEQKADIQEHKINQAKNSKLGDIWDNIRLVEAYQVGDIRSFPAAENVEDVAVHVEFINQSPKQALVLCWISTLGEMHHFHDLPPGGGGRMEISRVGDAFVLFVNRGDEAETLLERKAMCIPGNLAGAYRPKTTGCDEQRHIVTLRSATINSDTSDKQPTQAPTQQEFSPTEHQPQLRGSGPKRQKLDPTQLSNCSSSDWTISVQQNAQSPKAKPKPIDTRNKAYQQCKFGCWTVYCESQCWDEKPIHTNVDKSEEKEDHGALLVDVTKTPPSLQEVFQADMDALTRRIPQHVLEVLCPTTHIYMNTTHLYGQVIDTNAVGCFHPGRDWLKENLMNVDKWKQVEFYNVQEYYKHRRLWGPGTCNSLKISCFLLFL